MSRSTHQVLARRWRPQRFADLVGQEVAVRTLQNTLTSGQIAHAYLFSGLRGVGKTTVARLLAKALNCVNGPTPEPCGECVSCQDITKGSSLNVHEMDAASNRGIDAIRQIREDAQMPPLRDRYRIFILDEAHQITNEGFNALLKIIEEPPAHVVFILASTDKQKFPATIVSRCLQVDFRPIPDSLIVARLIQVAATDGFGLSGAAAAMLARSAEGSLRDALSLLDQVRAFSGGDVDDRAVARVLGLPPFETVMALWRALQDGDVAAALLVVRADRDAGHDAFAIYNQLLALLDSLLLVSCDPSAAASLPDAHRDALVADAQRVGVPLLLRLLGLALEQRSLLTASDRPGLAVATAVGRLAMWPRLVRVESLLAGAPPASGTTVEQGRVSSEPKLAAPGVAPAVAAAATPAALPAVPVPAAPQSTAPGERLVSALEDQGARLLAARLRAAEIVLRDDCVVVRAGGTSAGTIKSLRDASEQILAAARSAGLPGTVVFEGAEAENHRPSRLQETESHEGVRRVVSVFGGRIESVEDS